MPYRINPFTGQLDVIDVVGPTGATDNAIARYDGTTGKLIQDSLDTIQDGGGIEANAYITRINVTTTITVHTDEAWISPNLNLTLTGSIILEPDSELIIM